MSDNIKVVVKVRPLISREIEDKLTYHWRVKNNTLYQLDTNGKELGQAFTFDKVYDDDTKTSDVYNDIAKPIVEAATAGFNGTIFAYGQTSSGKTYTMTGTDRSPGIIPLAVLNLFEIIKSIPDRDFLVRVSYMEIYNETVKDLLNVENNNIKIQETLQGIKVDVTEKVTSSPEEVLEAMKEGEVNRQTGATNMNELSSRSHSIFQITIESREHIEGDSEGGCVNVSQLNLVDLAGSERAGQTGATGIRFKEGTHINKSLSSLALVIKQLSEDPKKHVNYRDSKLTRLLQNSLGGNAKTSIICAVTPVAVEETISTLQFANRAKAIKNQPEINAVATDATMIQRLTKQMSKLQSQLESKKNLEQDNFNLQKQITALQRLILNGFGQRRSIDMMQGRRKLQLPRRVTIHSTVSELESEPVVEVPKFCTPSLKYNPTLLQNTSDFVPIHTTNKLASVPEEPVRLITPPPRRTVNFSNEVINLDSDDDTTHDDQETCSPIHKCYGSSKTPPCVLRKNCKIAEKNLKDIVELTEREKIFSPSAVELMEKLEENATVMASLQDEVDLIKKISKDKDLQNDILKTKLEKKEAEIKSLCAAKDDIQTKCEDYSIKLTELEVIYETFKTKAKLREEELLSLLDEVKVKQPQDIGKLSQTFEKDIPFMDISKDISLVNSDNEISIVPDETEDINNIITDTQKQLASKSQSLVELEQNLFAHKQKISSLESVIQEREQALSSFNEKFNNIETENALLKSSIENLNKTISYQKENLLTAKKDIESYNSVIQELKVKLSQRENLSTINIDDSVLESMITSEEQFIANNENMMNIIRSFKLALDMRNKQIAELKDNAKDITENEKLSKQLQTQTEEISVLNSTVDNLKKLVTENIATIRKLMHENEDFKVLEQELFNEIAELKARNNKLQELNNENSYSHQNLTEEINRLKLEYTNSSTQQIADLTANLKEKDDLIVSLNKDISQSKEILYKAHITVLKSLSILRALTGNQEVPEIQENNVNICKVLSNSLNTLEIVACNIISEKEELNKTIDDLNADLKNLHRNHNLEITLLHNQIEEINKNENDYKQEIEVLNSKFNEAIEIRDLEISLNATKQEQLQQSLADKDGTIKNLTTLLKNMENQFKDDLSKINDLENQLKNAREENHNLVRNFFREITDVAIKFDIQNFSDEDLADSVKIYKNTLLTLENIANHITFITMRNVKYDNNQAKTNNKTTQLTDNNCDLTKNSTMELAIDKNREENIEQNDDLMINPQVLQDLQKELEQKVMQLNFMEDKVREWKKQFESLDFMMKQQMENLKIENENLKTHIENLEKGRTSVAVDDYTACDIGNSNRLYHTISQNEVVSPPSLVKICCEKIVDSMELQTRDSKSTISNFEVENDIDVNHCNCNQLKLDLEAAKVENSRLLDSMAEMEVLNQYLLEEQDVVRNEIQLLLEPAQELQKKIINHRTNLSILTATTYAENKSLQSQVKVLQHHHKRFHNVCQRDIPDVKKQLSNLMSLLKGDPSIAYEQSPNFKRYSLPNVLNSSTTPPNFKNESTLDGDLLMLDTNVTITTTADNTLTGHDQTCLDMTQFCSEATSQINDLNQIIDANIQQVQILDYSNEIFEKINLLKDENTRLQDLVNKYSQMTPTASDPQNNVSKSEYNLDVDNSDRNCANCKELTTLKEAHEIVNEKLKDVTEQFIECKSLKGEIEQKYNKLILEKNTMDALQIKLSIFEKEYNGLKEDISKLHNTITIKNKELNALREENDTLSNQVMDNVSEVDELTKVLQTLKQQNNELEIKCNKFEQSTQPLIDKKADGYICEECVLKDKLIQVMQSKETRTRAKLNRSLSDSDTLSRCNKICTLQSELHAGREDCKELTEDVVTIKNHLERSNISMDLDESLIDNNISSVLKDYEVPSPQSNKCNMPDIPEERTTDIYMVDKMDCLNYYVEKTGAQKSSLNSDSKIIEILKMLYDNLMIKHSNEIENLSNKLKDYDEAESQLRSQYNDLTEKYCQITKELEDKNNKYENSLSQLRTNINTINEELIKVDVISNAQLMTILKEPLIYLDKKFDLSSTKIFEYVMIVVNKNQTELSEIMDKYTKLQKQIETVTIELDSVNNNLSNLKSQLSSKEKEYDLLKVQKKRVHEITNAVTLDIVKREKELKDTIDKGYRKLLEFDIVNSDNLDSNLPLNTNINTLFDLLVSESNRNRHNKERENTAILLEINSLKQNLDEKQKEIDILRNREEKLQEVNNSINSDLVSKENKLQTLTKSHEDLIKTHENVMRENQSNILKIEKLMAEIHMLKTSITEKEHTRESLEIEFQAQYSKSVSEISDLVETVKGQQSEIINLKRLNEMIMKEKDSYAEELKKSADAIQKNNIDIDKMTSDILILRESVKDNGTVIETLRNEAKSLLKQNIELKEQLEKKIKECSRLETNIKTHEKTAQIQTRMIMRIEKQKSEDDKKLEELTQQYNALKKECEMSQTEIEQMRNTKEELQARVTELEASLETYKNRPCTDGVADSSRHRRRSIHDSKRIFADEKFDTGDHLNAEAIFGVRAKPDDLFADGDNEASNRSTPTRLSKGRDSLSLSRADQSDKDDEQHSRPSSVLDSRRRRQTLYDSLRSELSQTPPPSGDNDSSVSQLREQLTACQQELDDLKEKYRELDEECETCSQYLREREDQCSRLKKEKMSLQNTITELKGKLHSCNPNISQMNASKPKVTDASVNTDEDWANLHSVVVDRMSYDVEVEKNKKLTKTIEDLRFKKQDLKNTLAKMQKALERNIGNRELEATKSELQACKQELSELKQRYKELDEECETCAQYLRDKEEQCRRLKEAKTLLETKLQELQADVNPISHTSRKKRQSAHDQNRASTVNVLDAAAETSEDLLSYQVERDSNVHVLTDEKHSREVKHLKLAVERLMKQKSTLEQQLAAFSGANLTAPALAASGSAIVQNQQITDVMKENHKLKKINAKLINMCKKRGKESNRENEDPADQG